MAAIAATSLPFSDPTALSHIEGAVLAMCEQAANADRQLDSNDDLMEALAGCGFFLSGYGGGTIPGIMDRLERKGYIERIKFQRGRQIRIIASGKVTAPPSCTAPHWRFRPKADPIPTPAIHKVRELSIAAEIEMDARTENRPMIEHLMNLIYIGHHAFRAEREAEA